MTNNSYDNEINSGNRLIAIGLVLLLMMCSLAFVSAIETKGGVYNGGFEFGSGSVTAKPSTNNPIGDSDYVWECGRTASSTATCSYSTEQAHTGNQSMRIDANSLLNTGNRGGIVYVNSDDYDGAWGNLVRRNVIPAKPNTSYKLSGWIYNEDSNRCNMGVYSGTSSGTYIGINVVSSPVTEMSSEWVYRDVTFTTTSNTYELSPTFSSTSLTSLMTNGTCYFDDVRLEEVDTLSLSTQQQGRPSITITGVTDTNAIDQSQTRGPTTTNFGQTVVQQIAQSITPTQQKQTSTQIYLQKVGTPTDNLVITIEGETSDSPNGTVYASYTIASSSLTTSATPYTFNLPFISNLSKYTVKVARSGALSDTDYYATLRDGNGTKYGNGTYSYYNGSSWVVLSDDMFFRTYFAKLSSSVDLNVVAPDGTSELKSFDVNGDILTDANITINPDGTGKYYYDSGIINNTTSTYLNNAYKFASNIFDANAGQEAYWTNRVINNWGINNSGGISSAKGTSHYLTLKVINPNNCTINSAYFNLQSHGSASTGDHNLQVSNDNTNWVDLNSTLGGISASFNLSNTTNILDGNNVYYVRYYCAGTDFCQIGRLIVDANLSCPSLTTPLFKSGTNTLYTMNKDADNQGGATLTPSLMSNLDFSFTAPTTTFSSFQVPNTTDTNITLSCTSINGCKAINYKINNTGWKDKTNHDLNYFIQNHTSYGKGITSTAFTSSVPFQFLQTISGSISQAPGAGPEHPVYVKFNIYYRDGTTVETPTYGGLYTTNFSYTATKDYKDINYITSTTSGDNFYIQNLNADLNIYYNNPSRISFLYSGAGVNSIQYFSTDNSDNTETTKTSTFTTYGNARFNFIDENTYAPVTTTYTITPSINGITTGSATSLDLNLQGITNQLYGFQFSTTSYGTRFYYVDLNEFSGFDYNQLMLQDTNAANNITLKIYNTTGTTIQAGTPVTITKNNYLVGRYLTNTDGEITPFLNDLDTNYLFNVEGLYTTSQRPVLIYRPKFDSNFADISGNWQITLTGPNSTNRYTITTNSQVIAILPNTETLYSAKICMLSGSVCSASYFSRTYLLGFKGLVGETSIQPYLNLIADSTLRTLKVLDYATNQPYPLPKIVITSKTDLGVTYIVESLYTDSTGTAGVYLANGQTYTLTANDLTSYTIVPNDATLTYYIYFNFLVLPTETVTGLDVNTSIDFNGAEFFVMRNALFGCSGTSDCFPSALIAIVLTMIILVVATAVTVGNFIGVKGLSLIAFLCFVIFFGIGWLPIYIFAFLGSITLLLLVVVQ